MKADADPKREGRAWNRNRRLTVGLVDEMLMARRLDAVKQNEVSERHRPFWPPLAGSSRGDTTRSSRAPRFRIHGDARLLRRCSHLMEKMQ